jgi:hypothetical protein
VFALIYLLPLLGRMMQGSHLKNHLKNIIKEQGMCNRKDSGFSMGRRVASNNNLPGFIYFNLGNYYIMGEGKII